MSGDVEKITIFQPSKNYNKIWNAFESITYWRTSEPYVAIFLFSLKKKNCREEPHGSGGTQTKFRK